MAKCPNCRRELHQLKGELDVKTTWNALSHLRDNSHLARHWSEAKFVEPYACYDCGFVGLKPMKTKHKPEFPGY